MESIPGRSYGDQYAGSKDFDFIEFVRRPTTIARLISIVRTLFLFIPNISF